MATQQGIVKGDALQRIGSIGFIVGAILLIITNVLVPRPSDPSNVQELLTKWGENKVLVQLLFLLGAFAAWGVMIGVVGIYRSIATGGGAAWVRLGFYGIVVGTTVLTVFLALTMTTASTGASWLMAPAADKAAAYGVAATVATVSQTMQTMLAIVYWFGVILLAIGMVLSSVYPRWLGWVWIVLGILIVLGGVVSVFTGATSVGQIIFAVPVGLSTVWTLVVGIWVARRAW